MGIALTIFLYFSFYHIDKKKLIKLDLRDNHIEDQGVRHLADALQDNMVNVHFEPFYNFKNEIEEQAEGAIVKDYSVEKTGKARYIKVIAKNRGFCPEWHKGAKDKGKAWIFLDEITVE